MEQPYFISPKNDLFLTLERPIVFFDLETTGVNASIDRVVELYAVKVAIDGSQHELHYLINPTIPIPPAATAIHNITDEMVIDKPTFAEIADELAAFFIDCDLGGYNIKRFDVPMLMQEFYRCKKYPINFAEVKLVDAMGIFYNKEKRDLSAAVKFYCGKEHDNAHSAKADVLATIDILKQQLLRYEDLESNTAFLHDYLSSGNQVDLGGKFIRDGAGDIVFNFGKHKGEQACNHADYLKWMLDGDFSIDTKMVANRIYKNCIWETEIKTWLEKNKILTIEATASALYATIKFSQDVFPFATTRAGKTTTVTYLKEPPDSYILQHEDAVDILIKELDNFLEKGANM
jgi:DNA polymerase-3 subunit epsilon